MNAIRIDTSLCGLAQNPFHYYIIDLAAAQLVEYRRLPLADPGIKLWSLRTIIRAEMPTTIWRSLCGYGDIILYLRVRGNLEVITLCSICAPATVLLYLQMLAQQTEPMTVYV